MIGGAAISLAYQGTHATSDLDLWPQSKKAFWQAVERATAKSKHPVPVQEAAIAEAPESFEERLKPLRITDLRQLRAFVPEAHDLVLMKTARGEAHDLDGIEDIHRANPLRLETLVERYEEMRATIIGPPSRFLTSFLAVVFRLYGDSRATDLKQQLTRTKK